MSRFDAGRGVKFGSCATSVERSETLVPNGIQAARFFHRVLNPSQASATTRGIGRDPVR